jgi:hypothetical protein
VSAEGKKEMFMEVEKIERPKNVGRKIIYTRGSLPYFVNAKS